MDLRSPSGAWLGVRSYNCTWQGASTKGEHEPRGVIENYLRSSLEIQQADCRFCGRAIVRIRDISTGSEKWENWSANGPGFFVIQEEP